MKLTKESLKRIIKEELQAVMNEGAVYGRTGATEILDPNATDEYTLKRFRDFNIKNPKERGQESLRNLRYGKPKDGNYRWSYIIHRQRNEGNWGWQKLDNLRTELPAED
tara:strand:- start:457 stop:783 length:327 start_codon:yes stop_codon:yes gene_type:complete